MVYCEHGAIIKDPNSDAVLCEVHVPVALSMRAPDWSNASLRGRVAIPSWETCREEAPFLQRYSKFVWSIFDSFQTVFSDLPLSVCSLMMLLTIYMDGEGRVKHPEVAQRLLGLTDAEFAKLINRARRGRILEYDGSSCFISDNVIRIGKMDRKERALLGADETVVTDMYIRAVHTLGEHITKGSIEYLCYVLRLLPFVNWKYHIVCENPTETNARLLRPMTLGNFAQLIKYRKNESNDLLRFLMAPTCMVGDEACRIVNYMPGKQDGVENYYLCVDPRVCCP